MVFHEPHGVNLLLLCLKCGQWYVFLILHQKHFHPSPSMDVEIKGRDAAVSNLCTTKQLPCHGFEDDLEGVNLSVTHGR